MEQSQRKAFLDTRNCIAARLEMEDENEKLVRVKKNGGAAFKFLFDFRNEIFIAHKFSKVGILNRKVTN